MDNEELKERIVGELDIVEFLDIIDIDIGELVELIFDELSEEQRTQLERAVR